MRITGLEPVASRISVGRATIAPYPHYASTRIRTLTTTLEALRAVRYTMPASATTRNCTPTSGLGNQCAICYTMAASHLTWRSVASVRIWPTSQSDGHAFVGARTRPLGWKPSMRHHTANALYGCERTCTFEPLEESVLSGSRLTASHTHPSVSPVRIEPTLFVLQTKLLPLQHGEIMGSTRFERALHGSGGQPTTVVIQPLIRPARLEQARRLRDAGF
jgi:hypothetical protein